MERQKEKGKNNRVLEKKKKKIIYKGKRRRGKKGNKKSKQTQMKLTHRKNPPVRKIQHFGKE
jgi:hypothetical protein